MSLSRFFVEPDFQGQPAALAGKYVFLSEEDSHHAKSVLRIIPGNCVVVIDRRSDAEYLAEVESISGIVKVRIRSMQAVSDPVFPLFRLCFALCKNDKNDLVIEKVTELGVSEIVLFQAERSIVRLKNKEHDKKLGRWQRIAEAASKQSRRRTIPTVSLISDKIDFGELLASIRRDDDQLGLYCSTCSKATIHSKQSDMEGKRITIIIGPEGDFTDSEIDSFDGHGLKAISLGPLTLKSETAAIAAAAAINIY